MSRTRLESLGKHYKKQQEVNREIESKHKENLSHRRPLHQLPLAVQRRIADSHPLADERVDGMDVSHHDGHIDAPESAEYVGHFYVNNKRYELHRDAEGTIFSYPRYDNKALETMYGPDYFGDKATLQVGIPDRGDEEIKRRRAISELQVNEWKGAGIQVAGARVLEIGGGSGYLSQEVKRRGGQPTNVELCAERAEYCREQGVDAYNGMLNDAIADGAIKPGSVDIVACYDLLEHIVDPNDFMKDVRRVLREGGVMTIRIPETPSEGPTLHLVDHVNHFSRQSLVSFMKRSGFQMVQRPERADGKDPYYSGTFSESLNAEKDGKLQARTIENMTVFFEKKSPTISNQYSLMGSCREESKLAVESASAVPSEGAVLR